jgi:polyamine oxidase
VPEIVDLTDIAERGPFHARLARLHAAQWAHLYDPAVWNETIAAAELTAMSPAPGVPRTLLAFDGAGRTVDDLVGSVCVLASDDLAGWEQVGPWLASLFVMPGARGRGVGAALTTACLDVARRLGYDDVHLFTAGQEAYYAARGWRTVAIADANGTPAAVMVRRTDPHAARRSVVTSWVGDADFGGAYSFLRPGGVPADRDLLGTEVLPHLWLAGEHTCSAAPGTMHGAWFSGERAAAGVLDAGCGSVVIVGAGLAGLGAAAALRDAGVEVVVLEAGSRPGGRAVTDRTLGVPLHLGGAWLHGTAGHPLGGLTSEAWTWQRSTTYRTGDGAVGGADDGGVDGAGMLAAAEQARLGDVDAAVEGVIVAAAAALDDGDDVALGPVIRSALGERARDARDRAVLDAWIRGAYENLYAAPLDELSLRNRAEPYGLDGGDRLLTEGIDGFTGPLAASLDVRYGQRVTSVAATDGSCLVATDPGAGLRAEAVIVAVPIPVLHRGTIAFDPPLPDAITAAVSYIGCGPVAKVFATFDSAFWAPHQSFWVVGPQPLPIELFVDVTPLTGVPTLCGMAVGAHAVLVEAMDEDARCRVVDELLATARVGQAPPVSGERPIG